MTTIKQIVLIVAIALGSVIPMSGCALFTAQRVGTYAAKQTGKAVYRSYREHKDEKEYSDHSGNGSDYRVVNDRSDD